MFFSIFFYFFGWLKGVFFFFFFNQGVKIVYRTRELEEQQAKRYVYTHTRARTHTHIFFFGKERPFFFALLSVVTCWLKGTCGVYGIWNLHVIWMRKKQNCFDSADCFIEVYFCASMFFWGWILTRDLDLAWFVFSLLIQIFGGGLCFSYPINNCFWCGLL